MNILSYESSDAVIAGLRKAKRRDLTRYVPPGGTMLAEAASEMWKTVLKQFGRGGALDAITTIERWFEPRRTRSSDAKAMRRVRA